MPVLNLVLLLLFCKASSAASCGTTTITSQSDANALASACPTVTGDVILATNIVENISLDGVQAIQGALAGEPCSSSCTAFTSLNSSTLLSVTGNFGLAGMANLRSIDFPGLHTVNGSFALSNLAGLESLSIKNLSSVGQFQLTSAPRLSFLNLTYLEAVTGPSPSIEVTGVNLTTAPGLNPRTSLSSFVFSDVPSLQKLELDPSHVDYLEIVGNKDSQAANALRLTIYRASAGTLNLSGCGRITLGSNNVENLLLINNSFETLQFGGLKISNTLAIMDNQVLTHVSYPNDMSSVQNLRVSSNTGYVFGGAESGWPWNMRRTTSMIFEGIILENAFHEHQDFNLSEVTSEFILNSTVKNFDCTSLNSLRSKGLFQGNYSCQGKTLKAGPVRTTAGDPFVSKGPMISTPMFAVLAGIVLSLIA